MKKDFFSFRMVLSVVALLCLAIISCSKVEPKEVVFEEKDKTVLIYLAANNNLCADAFENINRITNGYVPTDGYLIVYCSSVRPSVYPGYPVRDTLPFILNIYKDKKGLTQIDTLMSFNVMNSVNKNSLSKILKFTKSVAPAREYGLVLWSHGTGWVPPGYYSANPKSTATAASLSSRTAELWPAPPGGIDPYAHLVKSFGEEAGEEISIFDLKEALGENHFSFIAMDACLMGGIETAYELRNHCDYYISSAAEILTDSFPYETVVEDMFKGDYNAVAKDVYDYYAAKSGIYRSVTISTVKTSELESVASAAKAVFDNYRDNIADLNMTKIQRYFRYNKHWFYDLNDFVQNLATGTPEAENFSTALNRAVTAKYTTGLMIDLYIDVNKFSGLSSYIDKPADTELESYYSRYEWNRDTGMIE